MGEGARKGARFLQLNLSLAYCGENSMDLIGQERIEHINSPAVTVGDQS